MHDPNVTPVSPPAVVDPVAPDRAEAAALLAAGMPHDMGEPLFERLHPYALWSTRLGALLGFGLLYVPVALVCLAVWDAPALSWAGKSGLFLLGVGGVAVLAWMYGSASYRHARFALSADGLHIRRGVFWRSEVLVPRSRVQHTDLNRGPIDRHLGIATLKVFTAGTKLASVALAGLPDARAIQLRDALVSDDDDAV